MANEVEVVQSTDLVPTAEASALLEKFFAETTAVEVEDPRVIQLRVMADILGSKTFEETFSRRTLTPWREKFLDQTVRVLGVRWNTSDFDDSPVYAVVDVADPLAGEVVKVSCGAKSVMAKLYLADQQGWLPAELKLISLKKTRGGFVPLDLVIP